MMERSLIGKDWVREGWERVSESQGGKLSVRGIDKKNKFEKKES